MRRPHQHDPNESKAQHVARENRYRAWLKQQSLRTRMVAVAGEIIHSERTRTRSGQKSLAATQALAAAVRG